MQSQDGCGLDEKSLTKHILYVMKTHSPLENTRFGDAHQVRSRYRVRKKHGTEKIDLLHLFVDRLPLFRALIQKYAMEIEKHLVHSSSVKGPATPR